MAEEVKGAIKQVYETIGGADKGYNYDSFEKTFLDDPIYRKKIYDSFGGEGTFGNYDQYEGWFVEKKKDTSTPPAAKPAEATQPEVASTKSGDTSSTPSTDLGENKSDVKQPETYKPEDLKTQVDKLEAGDFNNLNMDMVSQYYKNTGESPSSATLGKLKDYTSQKAESVSQAAAKLDSLGKALESASNDFENLSKQYPELQQDLKELERLSSIPADKVTKEDAAAYKKLYEKNTTPIWIQQQRAKVVEGIYKQYTALNEQLKSDVASLQGAKELYTDNNYFYDKGKSLVENLNDFKRNFARGVVMGQANILKKMDSLANIIGDATGTKPSGIFGRLSNKLLGEVQQNISQSDDVETVANKVAAGGGSFIPMVTELMLTPELKAGGIAIPKFVTYMAYSTALDKFGERVDELEKQYNKPYEELPADLKVSAYGELAKGGAIGTAEGAVLHALNLGAMRYGQNIVSRAALSGGVFAGYDAIKQKIQTGEINDKDIVSSFLLGSAMSLQGESGMPSQKDKIEATADFWSKAMDAPVKANEQKLFNAYIETRGDLKSELNKILNLSDDAERTAQFDAFKKQVFENIPDQFKRDFFESNDVLTGEEFDFLKANKEQANANLADFENAQPMPLKDIAKAIFRGRDLSAAKEIPDLGRIFNKYQIEKDFKGLKQFVSEGLTIEATPAELLEIKNIMRDQYADFVRTKSALGNEADREEWNKRVESIFGKGNTRLLDVLAKMNSRQRALLLAKLVNSEEATNVETGEKADIPVEGGGSFRVTLAEKIAHVISAKSLKDIYGFNYNKEQANTSRTFWQMGRETVRNSMTNEDLSGAPEQAEDLNIQADEEPDPIKAQEKRIAAQFIQQVVNINREATAIANDPEKYIAAIKNDDTLSDDQKNEYYKMVDDVLQNKGAIAAQASVLAKEIEQLQSDINSIPPDKSPVEKKAIAELLQEKIDSKTEEIKKLYADYQPAKEKADAMPAPDFTPEQENALKKAVSEDEDLRNELLDIMRIKNADKRQEKLKEFKTRVLSEAKPVEKSEPKKTKEPAAPKEKKAATKPAADVEIPDGGGKLDIEGYSVDLSPIEMGDGEPGMNITITTPEGEVKKLGNVYTEDVKAEVDKKIRGYELARKKAPKPPVEKKPETKVEPEKKSGRKPIDDIFDEFDSFNLSEPEEAYSAPEVKPEQLAVGQKLIKALINDENPIHKFEDMISFMLDRFGEERTMRNFDAVKMSYGAFLAVAPDNITNQMTDLAALKKMQPADFLKQQNDATDTDLPDTGSDATPGVDGGVEQTPADGAGGIESTERVPDTDSGTSPAVEGEGDGPGKKRGRGKRGGDSDNTGTGGRAGEGTGDNEQPAVGKDNAEPAVEKKNFSIGPETVIVPKGEVARISANIEAIKLLQKLEAENRDATPEEKEVLAKFTGWGGFADVLNRDKYLSKDANWLKKYGKQHEEIAALLSESEFKAAINSTINAHYTSREVISSMWDLVSQLGFTGGRILESSAGIGHFFGLLPENLKENTSLIGYELDSITGRILGKLYPEANIRVQGFEFSNLSPNSVDLAITNVPFGRTAPYDASYPELSKFSLHNYFIAKNIVMLKPGGLGVFITSSSTMDNGASAKFREWVNKEGNTDFVGAIRLPNNAFKGNANTEVTTDILVFRKRLSDSPTNVAQPFRYVKPIREVEYDGKMKAIEVNEYFADHPDMMLGDMKLSAEDGGGMYRGDTQTLVPIPGKDLLLQVKEAISKLPSDIYGADANVMANAISAEMGDKTGTLKVKGGVVYQVSGGDLVPVNWGTDIVKYGKKEVPVSAIVEKYISIKESLNKLLDAELNPNATDAEIEDLRNDLRGKYADFTDKYGTLNKPGRQNKVKFLEEDVEFDAVSAIESINYRYEATENNKVRRVAEIAPAQILTKRVNYPIQEPITATDIADASLISMSYKNKLDLPYMAKLLDITEDQVRAQLLNEGLAFENPTTGLPEDKDTYLSGFVREKLKAAKAAAAIDEKYAKNVDALEKVVPADIPPLLIKFKLGTPWIPSGIVEKWVSDVLGVTAKLYYSPQTGSWIIEGVSGVGDPKNRTTWGTNEFTGFELVEKALNLTNPSVSKTIKNADGSKSTVKDPEATAAAQAKQAELMDNFVNWVRDKKEYDEELARIYNDTYNGYVEKNYSMPVFEHFPGAATVDKKGRPLKLRKHQKKAVMRILQDSTLLAHQVGTGKTYTMITAAMEMRRLGRARKPIFIVQNATVGQFADAFRTLYPQAKLLVPSANQRDAKNRRRLFAMIAYNDWDSIIIPQSFASFIPDDPDRINAVIQEQIDELSAVIEEMKDDEENKHRVHELEKMLEKLEEQKAQNNDDNYVTSVKNLIDDLEVDGTQEAIDKAQQLNVLLNRYYAAATIKGLEKADRSRLINEVVAEMKSAIEKASPKIKDIARQQLSIERSIRQQSDRRTDEVLTFEKMGIDAMFYDEAHANKKLGFFTKMANIKGIDSGRSQRAFSTFMKSTYIQEKNQGKNVVFATGTPITNTMAEVWTMMKFIQPDVMQKYNISNFDQFAATFGSVEPSLEFTAAGKFKVVDRFKSYINAPELLTAFRSKTDVVLTEDVQEFKEDNTIPKLKPTDVTYVNGTPYFNGIPVDNIPVTDDVKQDIKAAISMLGSPDRNTLIDYLTNTSPSPGAVEFLNRRGFSNVIIPQSDALKLKMDEFREEMEWFEKLTGRQKRENRHIPLLIFNRAKQAAIDLRLIDPEAADDPSSKTNRVVKDILDTYFASSDILGTQLVFSDIYQSPAAKTKFLDDEETIINPAYGKERFNLYNDIKKKLIAGGIPENEIVIVHDLGTGKTADAKRARVFEQVQQGKVRVLIGSTEKMGVGVNVQDKMVALHHVDAPPRPMDFEQRNGRGLRQGNELAYLGRDFDIRTYGVEKTLDATAYGRLAIKQKFINQMMKGEGLDREMNDEADEDNPTDMSFEQRMAALSGSQYAVIWHAKTYELRKLETASKNHRRRIIQINEDIRYDKQILDYLKNEAVPQIDAIAKEIQEKIPDGEIKTVNRGEIVSTEKFATVIDQVINGLKIKSIQDGKKHVEQIEVNGLPVLFRSMVLGGDRPSGMSVKPEDVATTYEIIAGPEKDNKYSELLTKSASSGVGFINSFRNRIDFVMKEKEDIRIRIEKIESRLPVLEAEIQKPFTGEEKLSKLRTEVADIEEKMKQEVVNKKEEPTASEDVSEAAASYATQKYVFEEPIPESDLELWRMPDDPGKAEFKAIENGKVESYGLSSGRPYKIIDGKEQEITFDEYHQSRSKAYARKYVPSWFKPLDGNTYNRENLYRFVKHLAYSYNDRVFSDAEFDKMYSRVSDKPFWQSSAELAKDVAWGMYDSLPVKDFKGDAVTIAYGGDKQFSDMLKSIPDRAEPTKVYVGLMYENGELVEKAANIRENSVKDAMHKELSFNVTGAKIDSPETLADIFSAIRNPHMEVLATVYLRKGEVIHTTFTSVGLVNATDGVTKEAIVNNSIAMQADEVMLVHNHPSGNHAPSKNDIRYTREISESIAPTGIKFGGHVVIDTDKFTLINGSGEHTEHQYKNPVENYYFERFKLGKGGVDAEKNMFLIADAIVKQKGYNTAIVYISNGLHVHGFEPVSVEQMKSTDFIDRLIDNKNKFGAPTYVLVTDNGADLVGLKLPTGLLDIVDVKSKKQGPDMFGVKLVPDMYWNYSDAVKKMIVSEDQSVYGSTNMEDFFTDKGKEDLAKNLAGNIEVLSKKISESLKIQEGYLLKISETAAKDGKQAASSMGPLMINPSVAFKLAGVATSRAFNIGNRIDLGVIKIPVQDFLSKSIVGGIEEYMAKVFQSAATHKVGVVREFADLTIGWLRGAVDNRDYIKQRGELKGDIATGAEAANRMGKAMRDIIANSTGSMGKIIAVMDPALHLHFGNPTQAAYEALAAEKERLYAEIYAKKAIGSPTTTEEADLSSVINQIDTLNNVQLGAEEVIVKNLLTTLNTITHDTNMLLNLVSGGTMGIDKATWEKYRNPVTGNADYIARSYDWVEQNDEAEILAKQIMADMGIYMSRTDITMDKVLQAIKDPIYLTVKRYAQTMKNVAVYEYSNALFAEQSGTGVLTPRQYQAKFGTNPPSGGMSNGYVKMPGFGYGLLSNKWVAKHYAEDLKGYMYNTYIMSKFNDVTQAYDNLWLRRMYRAYFTVLNPGVVAGNVAMNYVWAFKAGINPFAFMAYLPKATSELLNGGTAYLALLRNGLIGSNVELSNLQGAVPGNKGFLAKAKGFYGGIDDVAKVQAYLVQTELNGYTPEEAIESIRESFQTSEEVGRYWDLAAKTPLVGNMFARFVAQAIRIEKNNVTKRPLYTIAWYSFLSWLTYAIMSTDDEGEQLSKEEKGIWQEFATSVPRSAPVYHYDANSGQFKWGDMPLSMIANGKRIDIARFVEPLYIWDQGNDYQSYVQWINKVSPYPVQGEKKESGVRTLRPQFADPLLGPIFSTAFDTDFRGRSIQDPSSGPWGGNVNLSDNDRMMNIASYLTRSYGGQYVALVADVWNAANGQPDRYGRYKDISDSFLNLLVKVQRFDDGDVRKAVEKRLKTHDREFNTLKTELNGTLDKYYKDILDIEQDEKRTPEQKKAAMQSVTDQYYKVNKQRYQKVLEWMLEVKKDMDQVNQLADNTKYEEFRQEVKSWTGDDDFMPSLKGKRGRQQKKNAEQGKLESLRAKAEEMVSVKEEEIRLMAEDEYLKGKQNVDRAQLIYNNLQGKDDATQSRMIKDYIHRGVITKQTLIYLNRLRKKR